MTDLEKGTSPAGTASYTDESKLLADRKMSVMLTPEQFEKM